MAETDMGTAPAVVFCQAFLCTLQVSIVVAIPQSATFFFWRRRISPRSVPRALATAAAPQTDGIPANQARYAPAGEITTCGERARAAHMRT